MNAMLVILRSLTHISCKHVILDAGYVPFFRGGTSLVLNTVWLATNHRHYARNKK